MMKTQPDPWADIQVPPLHTELYARRADPSHPFNFFWARNHKARYLFAIEYDKEISVPDRRPKLQGIQLLDSTVSGKPSRLVMELVDSQNKEIFLRLCLDMMESTRSCRDQKEALSTVIRRTWRWHSMLKGGRDQSLGPEQQKGLIGELRVLEIAFLPLFGAWDALSFWHGPTGAPKDFSAGRAAVESKARRGSSRPFVKVSSEHQLDYESVDRLFLAVTNVDESAADIPGSQTLTEHVRRIADLVAESDLGSLGLLESKLHEAGYRAEHDYGDSRWNVGETRWFRVAAGFPCLIGSDLKAGIRDVEYKIDLNTCDAWEINEADVLSALKGVAYE
jgi:hypothetical protein